MIYFLAGNKVSSCQKKKKLINKRKKKKKNKKERKYIPCLRWASLKQGSCLVTFAITWLPRYQIWRQNGRTAGGKQFVLYNRHRFWNIGSNPEGLVSSSFLSFILYLLFFFFSFFFKKLSLICFCPVLYSLKSHIHLPLSLSFYLYVFFVCFAFVPCLTPATSLFEPT